MGYLGMVGYASRLVAGVTCGWVLAVVTLKYKFLENFENEGKKLEPKEDVENN